MGPLNAAPQVDFVKLKRKPVPKKVLPAKSTKENVKVDTLWPPVTFAL